MRRLLSAALVVAGATVAACIHGPVVAYPPQTAAGSAAPRKYGDSILHGGLHYVTTNSPGILAGSGTSSSPLTATIHVDGTTITGTGSAGSPLVGAGGGLSGGVTGDLVDWASPTTVGNYAGTSCAAHKATTSFSAGGAATCSTFVDTAGTGLSLSTSTLNLANTAVTPGSYTLSGITVDAQGRLTAASSYAGAACAAGAAVTALSAAGVLTCGITPLTGTLTSGTVPVASGANALANSSATDDGTNFEVNGTKFKVVESTGAVTALGGITSSGSFLQASTAVYANSANANFIDSTGFGCAYGTNGLHACVIDGNGYSEGTTQYRDLLIEDGKGTEIAKFTGQGAPDLHVVGTFEADGNTTLGNASTDTTTVNGEPMCSGSAPTASCGTAAGTNCSGVIATTGAGTTCTVTWTSPGWTHTPPCTISEIGSTSSATTAYITAESATSMTFTYANAVGGPQTVNYNCGWGY